MDRKLGFELYEFFLKKHQLSTENLDFSLGGEHPKFEHFNSEICGVSWVAVQDGSCSSGASCSHSPLWAGLPCKTTTPVMHLAHGPHMKHWGSSARGVNQVHNHDRCSLAQETYTQRKMGAWDTWTPIRHSWWLRQANFNVKPSQNKNISIWLRKSKWNVSTEKYRNSSFRSKFSESKGFGLRLKCFCFSIKSQNCHQGRGGEGITFLNW